MTRRSESQPFNQERDTGRKGYREPWEPEDERPVIAYGACQCRGCREYGGDFWRDKTEQMTYESAVESNPKREDEGPMAYIQRISALVEGKYQRADKAMPHTRMSRVERERQLQKLRGQIGSKTEQL